MFRPLFGDCFPVKVKRCQNEKLYLVPTNELQHLRKESTYSNLCKKALKIRLLIK